MVRHLPEIPPRLEAVREDRIRADVFYLAEDPLPHRKLNATRPGQSVCTLYEADGYIEAQLGQFGYDISREDVRVQAFRRDRSKPLAHQYSPPQPSDPWYTARNLYAERRGADIPEEIILLLAHKDSQSWIDSPGANDNAVGTGGLLELARVLSAVQPSRTIRFLWCNEEHTPWTSVTAAKRAAERGDDLIAILNLDGIGRRREEDVRAGVFTNCTGYTRPEGEPVAEMMAQVNRSYGLGVQQTSFQRERPGDDDGSFVNAGYPHAVINIGSYPYADPNYHTEGDRAGTVDVPNAAVAARLILAAVLTIDRHGRP